MYHGFIANELVSSILKSLKNAYHTDIRSELINLLTLLYVSMRSSANLVRDIILNNLSDVSSNDMNALDSNLNECSEFKMQAAVMREFLQPIFGVIFLLYLYIAGNK
jgi:hypothetical protein